MHKVKSKLGNNKTKTLFKSKCANAASQHLRDRINFFMLGGADVLRLSCNNYSIELESGTVNMYVVGD